MSIVQPIPVAAPSRKDLGISMPTHGLEHPAILCCLGVIQVLGLISALATRLSAQACGSKASQSVFFVCLAMVAISTVMMVGARSVCWMTSGVTFSLMVLTAVWDFGRGAESMGW